MGSKDELERVKSIETDEISHENIKPKSMKPEEIDESVRIEDIHKFESMSDLEHEQPEFKKLNPKQSDKKQKYVEVQSRDNIENASILENEQIHQETVRPKSSKSVKREESIRIQESCK